MSAPPPLRFTRRLPERTMPAMFRYGSATALLFVLLGLTGLVAGCFDTSPALHPTGAECGGLTVEDAAECEGGVCLGLDENAQGMGGFCSAACYVDTDCTPHERCAYTTEGSFCLRVCLIDDDCYDAFVCRSIQGDPHGYCLVDPIF